MNGRKFIRIFIGFLFLELSPLLSFAEPAVEVSTATGQHIEYDGRTGISIIEGNAQIKSSTAIIKADRILINTKSMEGHAQGNVIIRDSGGEMRASEAFYNWKTSTGIIKEAEGGDSTWRFKTNEAELMAPGYFRLKSGDITSCSLNPPHYTIRSRRARMKSKDRINFMHPRFIIGKVASLYSPFWSKSLKPKKYSLRIEPGQSSRDGLINKTILGRSFTQNSYTRLGWKWLQNTGNQLEVIHSYSTPILTGNLDAKLIRDHNSDPEIPQERRWELDWWHRQNITERLSVRGRFDLQSDQTFGRDFKTGEDQGQARNDLLSEAEFKYQFPKATVQAFFLRKDRFDSSVSSKSFISKLTLPRFSLSTNNLKWKYFPVNTQLNASYVNETAERANSSQTLKYQQNGNANMTLKKGVRVTRNWTFTPRFRYRQSWKDRDLSSPVESEKDIYLGGYDTGLNAFWRVTRDVDINLGYLYDVRFKPNRTDLDSMANDRGVNNERINGAIEFTLGSNNFIELRSGYDLRDAPRDNPDRFKHSSERFTSPTLDARFALTDKWRVFFRETYSIFDSATREPVNTPQNTSVSFQYGNSSRPNFFEQQFTYTKSPSGVGAALVMNNKLKFYLTQKWYIDLNVSYRAVGENNLNYSKLKPIRKRISVTRDLHCWVFRMEFSETATRSEASFHIDLKANLAPQRNLFNRAPEGLYYRYSDPPLDISDVFPPEDSKPNLDGDNAESN